MWRDEKTEYLRRNRDYSRLLDGDDAEVPTPRRQNRGRSKDRQFDADADDVSPDRQEYLNRRRKLRELERQKLTKGKNGLHASGRGDEVQKAGEQNSRSGGGLALSKEKKKLPNDSSYGSFFGPTTHVVAKRIIEEARAREEAEIVAARESKATVEAEHRKKVARSSAGKVSRDPRPVQPPKPAYKATEKTRKLKEARDYSFLYDDSPLPDPKIANREGPSSSKLGIRKHDSTSVLINNHSSRKLTSERPKSTPEPRRSGGPATSARPLQSQPKSSQLSRSLPRQGHHDSPSNISAMKNMSIVGTSAKPLTSKVSSAGPGRPEPKGETKLRKAEMTKKLVSASRASDVNRSSSAVRRPQPSLTLGRRNPQILETDANQVRDRPRAQQPERRPTQLPERPPTRQPDRLPSRPAERQPAERQPSHATNRNQTQSTGMKPAQVKERERVGTNSSERGAVMSQGLKKGTPTGPTHRAAAIRGETRPKVTASQKLEMKPPPKGAARPALSDYNRVRYSEDRWQGQARHKRARSSSEELDERPTRKNKLPVVAVNSIRPRGRNPSEDDDDSFIDDDDDPANVSSMIHSIMGYNPNKYRGNDDFDDRTMEVGFRTIQAEERRSAREARLEDERELAMIEAEEREERLRKAKKKRKQTDR